MEDIYTINVDEDDFNKIVAGTKTAHIFVNDKEHNIYSDGMLIKFNCGDLANLKQVQAKVESVLYFPTLTEAVESVGREKCGFKQKQTFDSADDDFLSGGSYEGIEKYGVGVLIFNIKK